MKLFRTGSALSLPILTGLALSCAAQAGTLTGVVVDQGKPLAGAMVTAFSADADRAWAVAIQADGKIVVAGESSTGPSSPISTVGLFFAMGIRYLIPRYRSDLRFPRVFSDHGGGTRPAIRPDQEVYRS